MTLTIHADWWLLPLAVTIVAFVWAAWVDRDNQRDYSFAGIVSAVNYGAALIVSLK